MDANRVHLFIPTAKETARCPQKADALGPPSGTPQCAEDFVALVYAISRRGVQLRDTKARAYFFRVQQALLFTFLSDLSDRLPWLRGEKTKWETASSAKSNESKGTSDPAVWTAVLNALFFVCETMQDWTNDQVTHSASAPSCSVFSQPHYLRLARSGLRNRK
ncbi:unnamed protein product [Dibothriocephalus latus]|uniref:Uncharacterized protein n=1 Tax=Dibothriocephalus latus TaxID=60516 RepID=A0A3P6Q3A6_DIBLA|nr:unnamed protein product [Dibothriocephalus latus]